MARRAARAALATNLRSVIDSFVPTEYLTVPDLAERFGISVSRVRQLIEQRELGSVRIDGILKVPALFVLDDAPLGSLKGTIVVLEDAGFRTDEAVAWLLTPNEAFGMSPVEALRAGRKAEVRRVALALAF